ncbi:MAG: FAD-dependent oxidoreductase [Bacteroidota bacterium]
MKKEMLPKNTKIAIIGAGPSGIYAASKLIDEGYKQVTVFEKNDYIGGKACTTQRGTDMGAMHFTYPFPKTKVLKVSDSLGIKTKTFKSSPLDAEEKGVIDRFKGYYHLAVEAIEYLYHRKRKWQDANAEFGEVTPELHESWDKLMDTHHLKSFERAATIGTEGCGYTPTAPALYHVHHINPIQVYWGPLFPLGAWVGGVQQIWEKLAKKKKINVLLNSNITSINRKKGITIKTKKETHTFDELILACNPKDILPVLDATKEEKDLFSQIITNDYRVYEVTVSGAEAEEEGAKYFSKTIFDRTKNHPTCFVKRDKDTDIVTVYVSPSKNASDELIIKNVKNDLKKVGVTLLKVLSTKHWQHFPHVNKASLDNNFYKKLAAWQGKNNTQGTGAVFTFDLMDFVTNHAAHMVEKFIHNELPSSGVRTF